MSIGQGFSAAFSQPLTLSALLTMISIQGKRPESMRGKSRRWERITGSLFLSAVFPDINLIALQAFVSAQESLRGFHRAKMRRGLFHQHTGDL